MSETIHDPVAAFERLIDNDLDAAERTELIARLRDDRELRSRYVCYASVSSTLNEIVGVRQAIAHPIEPEDSAPHTRWRLVAASIGSIAAVLLIGAAIWMLMSDPQSPPVDPPVASAPVAIMVDAEGARWASDPHRRGDDFTTGEIAIDAGRLDIQMLDGAAVQLTGRTRFAIESASRGHLTSGRIHARMRPGSEALTVTTPAGVTVRDLGTEFVMIAQDDGAVEVLVIDGRVDVQLPDGVDGAGQRIELGPEQGTRVSSGKATPLTRAEFDGGSLDDPGVAMLDELRVAGESRHALGRWVLQAWGPRRTIEKISETRRLTKRGNREWVAPDGKAAITITQDHIHTWVAGYHDDPEKDFWAPAIVFEPADAGRYQITGTSRFWFDGEPQIKVHARWALLRGDGKGAFAVLAQGDAKKNDKRNLEQTLPEVELAPGQTLGLIVWRPSHWHAAGVQITDLDIHLVDRETDDE